MEKSKPGTAATSTAGDAAVRHAFRENCAFAAEPAACAVD